MVAEKDIIFGRVSAEVAELVYQRFSCQEGAQVNEFFSYLPEQNILSISFTLDEMETEDFLEQLPLCEVLKPLGVEADVC